MAERVDPIKLDNSLSKKKSLPFVLAALNEKEGTYLLVGINAAPEYGNVLKK